MHKFMLGLITAAGLTAAASAAPTWQTQIGFATTATGPLLAGNHFVPSAPGTYTFFVRAGIFNLQGQSLGDSNQGLFNLTANLSATGMPVGGTLGITPTNSRISPFTFGPATSFGGTLIDPQTITGVNAARDVSGGASAVWNFGQPQPTAPTPGALGVNSLTNVFRFTVTIPSGGPAEIVINLTGQAGPVLRWEVFGSVEPDETTPGSVNFLGITRNQADGGPLAPYTPTSLLISTPTPGAASLLTLATAAAASRRRRR